MMIKQSGIKPSGSRVIDQQARSSEPSATTPELRRKKMAKTAISSHSGNMYVKLYQSSQLSGEGASHKASQHHMNFSKIASLRAIITANRYHIDSYRLAAKILRMESEFFSS